MGSEIVDIAEMIESDTRTGPTLGHAPFITNCCLRSRVDDIVSRSGAPNEPQEQSEAPRAARASIQARRLLGVSTVTNAIASSDVRPRIMSLVCHTCRRRDEQKRLTAYSGGNVGIGSRPAEPRTVVYIESAMREHKESF